MSTPNAKWWHWLLIGAAFGVVAIVTGPVADRRGWATPLTLAVSLVALTGCTVSWVVGAIRLVKWLYSFLHRDSHERASSERNDVIR